MNVKLTTLGSL